MSLKQILQQDKQTPIRIYNDNPQHSKASLTTIKNTLQTTNEEYTKILNFLSSETPVDVLAPIDNDGGEFWVHAVADPKKRIMIDIGVGFYLDMSYDEAFIWVNEQVHKNLNRIEEIDSSLSGL